MLLKPRLSIRYGDIQVLWDIHLKIDESEVIALAGSNGAGKQPC
jgi:ABC-type branched-subunit amino acid transport system ATPase component